MIRGLSRAAAGRLSDSDSSSKQLQGFEEMAHVQNISKALKVGAESLSLKQLCDSPIDVLRGVNKGHVDFFNKHHVMTVRDLAQWKFAEIASGIAVLGKLEYPTGTRKPLNINLRNALDKKDEEKKLSELLKSPPEVLQGISAEASRSLEALGIKTVKQLGVFKPYVRARAMVSLAKYEAD